jgi:hypothetical protein
MRLRRSADHVPHGLHMEGGGCVFLFEIAARGVRLLEMRSATGA